MRTKTKFNLLLGLAIAISPLYASAQSTGTMYVVNDQVGVGTDSPADKLHVNGGNFRVEQPAGTNATLNFQIDDGTWEIKQNEATRRLTFFFDGPGGGATTASFKFAPQAVENLFRVGIKGPNIVDINGDLQINGTTVTPDYVFASDYELMSIEEQAAYMWENKHLPSVGAGKSGENGTGSTINVGQRSQAMLEELEKAHIYIDQLNTDIKQKDGQIADLEARLERIETALQSK